MRSETTPASEPLPAAPVDLDAYWAAALAELDALPLAVEADPMPLRSTDFATTYGVRFTSAGPYRLFAYLSVPHAPGPHPAIYHVPAYASVVAVPPYEERRRYVVLSLCARGQRLSDRPLAASYPGLYTLDIDDPVRFVWRGIVQDTVRGLDLLRSWPGVDASRIALTGNDLGLLAAALRPGVAAVTVARPLLHQASRIAAVTSEYPWEEVNDLVRHQPYRAAAAMQTLSYFEPLHLAARVQSAVFLNQDPPTGLFNGDRLAALAAALGGPVTRYDLTGYGARDRAAQEQWLADRLGMADPSAASARGETPTS